MTRCTGPPDRTPPSDPVKYGRFAERPVLDVRVPTLEDPDLAPEGRHVVTILAHSAPYSLKGGWNDAARQALRRAILAVLEHHAPGLGERVLGSELLTPADLERRYGLTGGQLHHGEPALDQLLHMRPDPECARGATPLPGLFLCGSGSHPGGGISGIPGLLGARAVLAADG